MRYGVTRRIAFNMVDTVIVILCLPFYAVAIPAVLAHQWLLQRRTVYVGLEVTHWPARDLREDYLVVDVSRIGDGLVGIKRRFVGALGYRGPPPPFPDNVEYISVARFWVPRPLTIFKPQRSAEIKDPAGPTGSAASRR